MTRDELRDQAVDDPRLSPEALRVVLHVWKLGEGEHAVKGETLSILLGAGEKPIRAAIARATHCGYVSHRFGGRAGHYLALSENGAPQGVISVDPEAEITPLAQAFPENSSPRGGISPPSVVVGEGVEEPSVGSLPELDDRASAVIDASASLLTGCRGALRDYLAQRVSPARQYSYVQTVVTAMNGFGFAWRARDGTIIPVAKRAGLIAAALNQLGATDEGKRKFGTGDPANLFTKLEILCRGEGKHERSERNGRGGDRDLFAGADAGGPGGEAPRPAVELRGGRFVRNRGP